MVDVRELTDTDVFAAVRLHLRVLDMEFLSRFGPRFMSTYYRAWIEAPGSISLAAFDEGGDLRGVLLGATDPANHVRAMVRQHGGVLGTRLLAYALGHPRLAKDLVVTRGWRYARGVTRLVITRLTRTSSTTSNADVARIGEITHVLVDPDVQGQGIGRALIDAAVLAARDSGVAELVLVTPPDLAARHFYERLGWQAEGVMRSRSGEEFLRFRFVV